jgi:hypothetical protein
METQPRTVGASSGATLIEQLPKPTSLQIFIVEVQPYGILRFSSGKTPWLPEQTKAIVKEMEGRLLTLQEGRQLTHNDELNVAFGKAFGQGECALIDNSEGSEFTYLSRGRCDYCCRFDVSTGTLPSYTSSEALVVLLKLDPKFLLRKAKEELEGLDPTKTIHLRGVVELTESKA